MEITKVHDKFFKKIFERRDEVMDFVKHALPKDIVNNLEFADLELDPTAYIDEVFDDTYSDIVYTCKYKSKTEIKIAFLFEHKSNYEAHSHLQLLGYILRIWAIDVKQKRKFKPVIPILFYHGKRIWDKQNFLDYFENGLDDTLLRFIPKFDFIKVDMHNYTDEKINETFETLSLQAMMLAMKHIYDSIPDLIKSIGKIYKDIDEILSYPNGQQIIDQLTFYLLSATQIKPKDMENQVKQITKTGAVKFQSGLDKWLEDDRKDTAMKMIAFGMTDEQIAFSAKLDIKLVVKLRKIIERTKKEYKTL
ncbi:MAG: Rpn family recombination-promoting nuclease/putative transposase [Bacteroidota bacterium]|nr:Rpn family recombination-promoting nuclease/putative transposase [Bacteroidota bacterium]